MNKYAVTDIKLRRYAVNVHRLRINYGKLRKNVQNSVNFNPAGKQQAIRNLMRREDEAIRRLARGMFNLTPSEIANFVGAGGIAAFSRF